MSGTRRCRVLGGPRNSTIVSFVIQSRLRPRCLEIRISVKIEIARGLYRYISNPIAGELSSNSGNIELPAVCCAEMRLEADQAER